MSSMDRQYIGILASDGIDKEEVFINKAKYIQYMIKNLLLPVESDIVFTGYLDSFEEEIDFEDDEYSNDSERTEHFKKYVGNHLFIFSKRKGSNGEYPKLYKASLIDFPSEFNEETRFYSIPVFCSGKDKFVEDWENDKNYYLYRQYFSREEFLKLIDNKKAVGRVYGYKFDDFVPSFVLWRDESGRLFVIGRITLIKNDALGNIVLEQENECIFELIDEIKYLVYDLSANPTVAFIPDKIYKCIEEELVKRTISLEKRNLEQSDSQIIGETFYEGQEKNLKAEVGTVLEEDKESTDESLVEIDTSVKDDNLIIKLMDYHSQKRGLFYSKRDFINIHTSIKCNNLVILSGLSGTGKSAIVDVYCRSLGINYNSDPKENRLLFIPVRPSWNDDADLLGYVDLVHMVYRASDTGFVDFLVKSQKEENKNKLFIVCFDEMNLARVEHYFSQFLSILERPVAQRELQLYDDQYSGRLYNSAEYPSRITLGDNIRFIGTVNIDESTYHFSDKVLDRANVIQLDVVDYSKQWVKTQYGALSLVTWSKNDYDALIKTTSNNYEIVRAILWDIHNLLQSAGAKYGVGPRVVKSIETYLENLPDKTFAEYDFGTALDYQIAQRVLTKVRGSETQLSIVLNSTSEVNLLSIFDKYTDVSTFEKCRQIVSQKQREMEAYGYCI